MNVRKLLLMLICMSMPALLSAQSDSTKKKIPLYKRPPNSTKLDLVYQQVEHYSSRSGYYSVLEPGVRIDNARPAKLDNKGDILRKYYTRTPLANDELELANKARRKGTAFFVPGLVVAPIALFGGLGVAVKTDKTAPLIVGFGVATSALVTSFVMKMYQNRKATNHVKESISIYNSKYYKPVVTDSAAQNTVAKAAAKDSVPKSKFRTVYNMNF